MNNKSSRYLVVLNSALIAFFFIHTIFFPRSQRSVQNDIVQGILIGFALAFVVAQIYARFKATKINGWITMFGLGMPGNGMLLRAAHAQYFPGPVNSPQEAMYWTTYVDGNGHSLNGRNDYVMHFPPGGLPPNDAFWSLTMADDRQRFVPNAIDRYSVSDRSGLIRNADDSTDIFIQRDVPAGHEANWLPAPAAGFILWLRVYMPDQAILDGEYVVPPIRKAKRDLR